MGENDDLLKIVEACGKTLDEMNEKYERRHIKNIWCFLKLDMRFYIRSAVLGLGFSMLWSCLFNDAMISIWSAYFIFLVLLSIYQQYRIREYGVQEVSQTCYLNPARIFCYQSIALTILETCMLLVCYLFIGLLTPVDLPDFLLNIYIPLCISQGMLLWMIKYIRHILVAMGLAAGTYACVVMMSDFSLWMLGHAHDLSLAVSIVYVVVLAKIWMGRKERLWN